MSGAANHRGSSKQDYATPSEFIAVVKNRFGPLHFDLAASAENTKAMRFFSEDDDALRKDWTQVPGRLWLNPPFGNIEPWAKKCAAFHHLVRELYDYALHELLFLVPASVGSNWFANHVAGRARVYFLQGRLSFDGRNPFPKDCLLAVFGYEINPGYEVWNWREQRSLFAGAG